MIDVGGGDSRLVDHLIERGLTCVSVLDISPIALARAKERLGARASLVSWIEADVTAEWPVPAVDVWHDRAVFHFLTDATERDRYRARLNEALRPGGSLIIATFALEGPPVCSDLPVARYSPETLARELGPRFHLDEATPEPHVTPAGKTQEFWYTRFTRT